MPKIKFNPKSLKKWIIQLKKIFIIHDKLISGVRKNNLYSYETFIRNEMVADGFTMQLFAIAEILDACPIEIEEKFTIYDWTLMHKFRTICAHDYVGIDYDIVWKIYANGDLDKIINNLTSLIELVENTINEINT